MDRIVMWLVALACFIGVGINSAYAIGLGNDNPPSGGGGGGGIQTVGVDVSNRISNDTRAAAQSYATGGIGQAVSGGSQAGVNFAIETPRNTPSVFNGNIYPTAPCMGSTTVGGSGVGFGIGIGTSWKDDECGKRETARSFNSMGLKEDALAVLCSSEYAAVAPSCKKE
jgi:hypothetical protein